MSLTDYSRTAALLTHFGRAGCFEFQWSIGVKVTSEMGLIRSNYQKLRIYCMSIQFYTLISGLHQAAEAIFGALSI